MPENPGWVTGYVPSAAEWNNQFADKVDYPAPLDQGGTGGISAAQANYNLQQRFVVGNVDSPVLLTPLAFYGLRTATGVITVTLPGLNTLQLGDWIELADLDFSANVNNVTIGTTGGDVIALYGSAAATQTLDQAGARVTLVANNSTWRMLV